MGEYIYSHIYLGLPQWSHDHSGSFVRLAELLASVGQALQRSPNRMPEHDMHG